MANNDESNYILRMHECYSNKNSKSASLEKHKLNAFSNTFYHEIICIRKFVSFCRTICQKFKINSLMLNYFDMQNKIKKLFYYGVLFGPFLLFLCKYKRVQLL